MPDETRRQPITDEDLALVEKARQQLHRDLEEAARRPKPPVTSPGKFTEPLGLDAHGNLQPPLTPEEKAHNEEVRRRALRHGPPGTDTPGTDTP